MAAPRLSDLITYSGRLFNNNDWDSNCQTLIDFLTSGNYDPTFGIMTATTILGDISGATGFPTFNLSGIAGENISAGDAVRRAGGLIFKATNASAAGITNFCGIAINSALTGSSVEFTRFIYTDFVGLTDDATYFIGAAGAITTSQPASNAKPIGFAFGTSTLFLSPLTQENATFSSINATGTIAATLFSGSGASLTNLNATNISSGTLSAARGGTGVSNNVASTITISGSFGTTFTVSGITAITLPTTGTLVNTAVTTLSSLTTIGTLINLTVTNAPIFSAMTAGSVLFAGTSGVLSQDNTNFFWDDTNNRLGIGTTTPAYALEVVGPINSKQGQLYMQRDLTDTADRRNWGWVTETSANGDVTLIESTANNTAPSLTRLRFQREGGDFEVYTGTSSAALVKNFYVTSAGNAILVGDFTVSGGDITIGADCNFYRSAANVLKTDDALLVSLTLGVTGLSTLGSALVSTTLDVTGNFAVNTNKFTVAASTGNTIVAGTLGITGDLTVNTNKFTVTASNGNTVIAGTLGITGAITTTLNGSDAYTIRSASTNYSSLVLGVSTGSNISYIQSTNSGSGTVRPLVFVIGATTALTLDITQNATFAANASVTGTLSVTGTTTATGGIDSSGDGIFKKDITIALPVWNLSASAPGETKTIAHGLNSSKILSVAVSVLGDDTTSGYTAGTIYAVATNSGVADVYYQPLTVTWDATNIIVQRNLVTGGVYDSTIDPFAGNTNWDGVAVSRGPITITFKV